MEAMVAALVILIPLWYWRTCLFSLVPLACRKVLRPEVRRRLLIGLSRAQSGLRRRDETGISRTRESKQSTIPPPSDNCNLASLSRPGCARSETGLDSVAMVRNEGIRITTRPEATLQRRTAHEALARESVATHRPSRMCDA